MPPIKNNNKIIKNCALIFSLSILFIGQVSAQTASNSTSVDQLNSQKSDRQAKLLQLDKQIKAYQQQISSVQSKAATLKNEIFIYDRQIDSAQLQIEAKQTQIDDNNAQIADIEALIQQKNKDIADNKQVLSELIVQLNEFDGEYLLKTTIGSNHLSDFVDQIQYTQNFQDKIYQLLKKIKDLKAKLEADQHELQVQLKNLEDLKEQLKIAQASLTTQRNQKQSLLNQTRGLERNYQKLLASSKQDEANLQKEIQDLDNQIRAKLGKRATPQGKGLLAWPIDGILTQKYGNTGFTSLGYTFHNGIDVAAPAGQPIYAAADGVIKYTDQSDAAFGNWVAIGHSIAGKSGTINLVTVYGHLKTIKVKPGQSVQQGDLIGYEGNTGNTTRLLYGPERGYHLHFGVYDAEGFGVAAGQYKNIYGNYLVPFGYTYSPLDFL